MFTEPVQPDRAERKRRTTARIVEAAARLFGEHGFRGTTVRRIAEEAGVSVGAVMAVGDKESLLSLVYDRAIAARLPAPLAAGAAVSATDHLAGYFLPFLDLFAAHEELARAYFRALTRGRPASAALGRLRDLAEADLAAAMENTGMSGDRARRGAQVMFAGYLGELMLLAAGATDRGRAEARLRETAELVTAGGGRYR
jgi:AcrR family transcriptional regulator